MKLSFGERQPYRIWFDYLKTCLEFPNDFKVDKSKYTHWKLNLVSKYKFNQWWSKVGSSLFEKQIEQEQFPQEVPIKNPNREYSCTKYKSETNTEDFSQICSDLGSLGFSNPQ